MKTIKLELTLCKTFQNEWDETIDLLKQQITCTVESVETDAFYENGHPNSDWLAHLARKQMGCGLLSLLSYKTNN